MKPLFLIFGFGYTAQFLAPQLCRKGFQVIGSTRDKKKRRHEPPSGYSLIDFSDAQDVENCLSRASHVLLSIPPVETLPDIVLHQYSPLIRHYSSSLQWLGYLSSTGVYGDHHGRWVNESSPCKPADKYSRLRLDAEKAWVALAEECQLPLHVFRLAGIYGPGRNALERIQAGKKTYRIYRKGQVFSRIYIDDILAVIMASLQAPKPMSLYNLADDEPAPSHVVDAYASRLLNKPALPLIPFEEAELSLREQAFYASSRRVSNKKIKEEFNLSLQYPSFRQGLQQIMQNLIRSD